MRVLFKVAVVVVVVKSEPLYYKVIAWHSGWLVIKCPSSLGRFSKSPSGFALVTFTKPPSAFGYIKSLINLNAMLLLIIITRAICGSTRLGFGFIFFITRATCGSTESKFRLRFCFFFYVAILQFPDRLCETEANKIFMRQTSFLSPLLELIVRTSKCSLSPECT